MDSINRLKKVAGFTLYDWPSTYGFRWRLEQALGERDERLQRELVEVLTDLYASTGEFPVATWEEISATVRQQPPEVITEVCEQLDRLSEESRVAARRCDPQSPSATRYNGTHTIYALLYELLEDLL
jgi:hypothetical protein